MSSRNHFEVLGVAAEATIDEIRRAYHQLARKHHPDRFRDPTEKRLAEELFTAMTEAFNVLTDGDKRRAYEEKLRAQLSGESASEAEAKRYIRAAMVKLQDNSFAEAVRLLKAAIHLDPSPALYHAHLATALEKQGSPGEAARAWDEAIQRDKYNAKYYRLAGQCLERTGMTIRAKRMFESALKWDKEDTVSAEALRRLGADNKKAGTLSGLFKRP